jgi:hypothetical protein
LFFDYAHSGYIHRAALSVMSPETAKALEKHVSGSQLRNQKISIKVNALLDYLSRNKN